MIPLFRRRPSKVAHVAQMEVAECGAACLSMVLGVHGYLLPLAEARQACGVSRDGVSAFAIVEAARSYACEARGMRLEASALDSLTLPAILHWNENHFVVLERLKRNGAIIVDPALGRRRVFRDELERSFTGVALVVEPGPRFERRGRAAGEGIARRLLSSVSRPFVGLIAAALLLEVVGVLTPAATQVFVDHVLVAHRVKWFWVLLLALGSATCLRALLQFVRERLLTNIQFALDVDLMARFVDHMLHLPAPYFDQRTTGDLSQRVDANTALRDLTIQLGRACLDGFLLLVYGVFMLAYDLRLGAIVLTLNVLRVLLVLSMMPRGREVAALELVERGREQGAVVEAFASPEVIKAFASEHLVQERYERRLCARLERMQDRQRLVARVSALGGLVHAASQGAVIWLGGMAVIQHEMTLGTLAGFLTLQQLVAPALDAVAGAVSEASQVQGILARIEDVLATPRARTGSLAPGQLQGDIVFENVSFRYGPSSPWAIRNVSFVIRRGEKVALIGRSGQGKSTLVRLLLGIVEPTHGRILIDGKDLATLDRGMMLSQVGVVLQESFLLDDSVRANLALRTPEASDAELWRAARLAEIDDVITSLPDGMNTRLGPMGRRLSGGQRQRLCLARALVGRPRMLVLDESTSALDATTEARVHQNLSTLACTRVLIAHRLSTVEDSDRIFVLEGGEIVDAGDFAELSSRDGMLRAMQGTLA